MLAGQRASNTWTTVGSGRFADHTRFAYNWYVEFIEAPIFTQLLRDYLGRRVTTVGFSSFSTRSPEAGDIIPGTGGFQKATLGRSEEGARESAAVLRVIYYYLIADTQIWFMKRVRQGRGPSDGSPAKRSESSRRRSSGEIAQRSAGRRALAKKVIYGQDKKAFACIVKKRSLFRALMSGVQAMREHREGRVTLRTHDVVANYHPTLSIPTSSGRRAKASTCRARSSLSRSASIRERWNVGSRAGASPTNRPLCSSGLSENIRTRFRG